MILQYSRHNLWKKDYEFNYDLSQLSLSWLLDSSDEDSDLDRELSQLKHEKMTNSFQETDGENLIYFSVSTRREGEFHRSVIEEIVQRFNLSTPTAHLKPAFQHLSFLGHKVHCWSIKDSEGIQRMLRQVEYEQRTITAINDKYRKQHHQTTYNTLNTYTTSQSSSLKSSDSSVPLPLHLIVIGGLEEILFPPDSSAHSASSQEDRDKSYIKNLNFIFKNSDSAPALKNVIVLLTVNHPSHHSQSSEPSEHDTLSVIRSLPQLKEYYGLRFGRGTDFNGDALVGRISRFAVEDVSKPVKPSSSSQSHCTALYSKNDVNISPWEPAVTSLTSENSLLLEQTASAYFNDVKAKISARDSATTFDASAPFILFLVVFAVVSLRLYCRRSADSAPTVERAERKDVSSSHTVTSTAAGTKTLHGEEKKEEIKEVHQENECEVRAVFQAASCSIQSEDTFPQIERDEKEEIKPTPTKLKAADEISKRSQPRTPFSSPPNEMRLRNGKSYVPSASSGGRKRGSTSRSQSRSTTLETANIEEGELHTPSTSKEKSARKRK
eukprot:gene1733-1839_t